MQKEVIYALIMYVYRFFYCTNGLSTAHVHDITLR